ncbi:hypothetical protein GCM10023322_49270 [Rugosimonospora acidiphila]|uniref:Carbon monoxide dehydrogenase subunit G n=1 Tax=Rugosimonospora acidiphila TaxID=556531 RepID=A0ABP9S852_9ACTN
MRLDHTFVVPVPAGRAWAALLDAEAGPPLLAGAAISPGVEDRFAGTLRVRIGPFTLCYQGSGRYIVKDPSARRLMVEAAGQDVHGGGTAAATATATLRETSHRTTRVEVSAELAVTGRLVRTNRRLVQAAGAEVLSQFAEALTARAIRGEVAGQFGAGQITAGPLGAPVAAWPAVGGGAARGPRRVRDLVPYACAFALGGLLTLAMMVAFG